MEKMNELPERKFWFAHLVLKSSYGVIYFCVGGDTRFNGNPYLWVLGASEYGMERGIMPTLWEENSCGSNDQ